MRITILVVGMILTLGAGAAMYARGPVGPESIVHKEVGILVQEAAESTDARIVQSSFIEARSIPVSFELDVKRILKLGLSKIGLAYGLRELGEQYAVTHSKTHKSLILLVRLRGDHVLALALKRSDANDPFFTEFKEALRLRFPGYKLNETALAPTPEPSPNPALKRDAPSARPLAPR